VDGDYLQENVGLNNFAKAELRHLCIKLTNMKKKKNKTAREKNSTAEYSPVEKKV